MNLLPLYFFSVTTLQIPFFNKGISLVTFNCKRIPTATRTGNNPTKNTTRQPSSGRFAVTGITEVTNHVTNVAKNSPFLCHPNEKLFLYPWSRGMNQTSCQHSLMRYRLIHQRTSRSPLTSKSQRSQKTKQDEKTFFITQ